MNFLTTAAVLLPLGVFNVLLHTLGCYLLVRLYKKGTRTVQHVYLINLSLCAILKSSTSVITITIAISTMNKHDDHFDWPELSIKVVTYLGYINETGVYYMHFASMLYITADRLLSVVFNVRYHAYWTKEKAWKLVLGTWVTNFILTVIIVVLYYIKMKHGYSYHITDTVTCHIPALLNALYVMFAIATYVVIFRTFVSSKRETTNVEIESDRESTISIFKRSRFFVSVLLIFTYICFMVIPTLNYTITVFIYHHFPRVQSLIRLILERISDSVDGAIYVFLNRSVRKVLRELMTLKPQEKRWLVIFKPCSTVTTPIHDQRSTTSTYRQRSMMVNMVQLSPGEMRPLVNAMKLSNSDDSRLNVNTLL